ncbi:MAG: DUF3244 domain-containing protein [Prevotella sp.]|jgi:hypothetical protein|nr:DUF3244 domain-containing protein [Prevotella sp.]
MKKNILFFAMLMLLSSTCISTFANNPDNDPMPITGAPNIPIRKSPHMSYIIDSMDNGVCSLTFMRALDNTEIRIYQNGILIDQNSGSFAEGETYTLDLQGYGKGEYTIEVYYSGNKIFSSSEEI